eukprot:2111351-Prymnesium_polylepis.1
MYNALLLPGRPRAGSSRQRGWSPARSLWVGGLDGGSVARSGRLRAIRAMPRDSHETSAHPTPNLPQVPPKCHSPALHRGWVKPQVPVMRRLPARYRNWALGGTLPLLRTKVALGRN